MVNIRSASLGDAARILEIYDYYVKNTAITFEYETPSLEAFQMRMKGIMERYPYFVIEQDGAIQGYAYAAPYITRAACDWSCEVSIYLEKNARKCGLGRKLYEALEDALRGMGIINVYASIACPETADEYLNYNSADFHAHLNFREIGRFRKCGYKFGRWYHLIWVEKVLGEHSEKVSPIVPYKE